MPAQKTGLRPPQQSRSRESLERSLWAAEKILAEKGYEGFTVAEVSRMSKVSVGSVYGRFENKDALVYEIHRRMCERFASRSTMGTEAIAHETDLHLRGVLTKAVHLLSDDMDRERGLLRAFMLRGAVDQHVAEKGSEASQRIGRAFKHAVLACRDEIGHPDPDLASDLAFRILYDVLARHVMYGPRFESDTERSWNVLVDELIHALFAYLSYDTAPRVSR